MIHGDDKGLVLPPKIAPVQVVIVPIPFKGAEPAAIEAKAKEICDTLVKAGFSVILDNRAEYTPGWKFNQWELKGVPVRIEIGPRDLKQEQVVMVRRDTKQKSFVKMVDAVSEVEKLLDQIQKDMFAKARLNLEQQTTAVKTYEELKQVICDKGGFVKAAWCGGADCEGKIKDETGATIRLIPFEHEEPTTDCILCGKKAKDVVYFARSY